MVSKGVITGWNRFCNKSLNSPSDGVAVLHLDGNGDHCGAVDAVLRCDLPARVLHCLRDCATHCVERSEKLGIRLRLTFDQVRGNMGCWGVTEHVNNILADWLVFNLLRLNRFCGADLLSMWGAHLGHEDINLRDTVRSGHSWV